ncbi:MAG: ABC transporter substrate-binding protein [Pseudomonadota bacterium]
MTQRNTGVRIGARITLSALTFCAVAGALTPPRAAADEVPVGAVFAVTGELQALEAPSAKGAQLYFTRNPDTGLRLDLIDSGADVPGIKDKVAALLHDNPGMAAVFGLTFTEGALLAAQAAEADDVVFLTSGATSPKLPFEVPGYLYMAAFGDNVQAAAAAEFAAQRLGAQSAAVLYDRRHVYTTLLEGYFRGSFEAQGGSIASVTGFDGPDALEEVLDSLQTADIVFLSAETADEAAAAVATLRAHGVTQPVIGGDGYDADGAWDAGGFGEVYFTTHAFYGLGAVLDAHAQSFVTAYRSTYGEEPSAFAGLAYDAAGLIADAAARAATVTPDAVRAALAGTENYPGVTGTISYPDGSQIPTKSVTILEIKDGRRSYVDALIPTQIQIP